MRGRSALALVAGFTIFGGPAEARITRIEITSGPSPTFVDPAGTPRSFGAVGTYEKLRGRAYGELDPNDRRNADIVDIGLAPLNANGRVEYSMDIYILKPTDLGRSNHKLFMEVNNRGGKLFGALNGSSGGNDPTTAADAGDAFLMNMGYSLAWNGWDISAPAGGDNLTIVVPTATDNGAPIAGASYEYLVFDNATTLSAALSYPAATLDPAQATLTRRRILTDPPEVVAPEGWRFTDATHIALNPAGTAFEQSWIYELTYTATNPVVAAIGFAATRDFVSFLRGATADDAGHPNPLAGDIRSTVAFTVSQPGRYMNDFIGFGFNEDENGRRVFDGVENWIAGGNGVGLNYRFAQPGRTERNRQNHLYPEANFPFAFRSTFDRLTGQSDGRNARCAQTATCPLVFEIISSNEYWVKAGSLVHTDPRGRDLPDPRNVRFYLLSSTEHTVAGAPANSPGTCQQPRNTTDPNPALRALLVALDEWINLGRSPPRSQVPRVSDQTAVFSVPLASGLGIVPQDALGWPDIPGVRYTGLITVRHLFDWGPGFAEGILTHNPPAFAGPVYPSFVSRVDEDGNEVAGIRLPPVAVPVATTSGWGLRAAQFGGPDGCESSGQWIAFPATAAERIAAGDPRSSLEERYHDHDRYVRKVARAARKLARRRLLLAADVQKYIADADASSILR